ncbi:MAG: FtsX-like permease family protein, partial [Gammaproteobacteria bacterium]
EMATLRALGLTRGQLWMMTQAQTGVLGLVAGVLALPLGLALALILVFAINRRSFGWTMELHVDPAILAEAVAMAILAALLAGVYPGWSMANASPAAALREE